MSFGDMKLVNMVTLSLPLWGNRKEHIHLNKDSFC